MLPRFPKFRRLRDTVLAAQVRHLHPGLLLTQHADDLLLSEPASLHPSVSLSGRGLYLYLEEFQGLRSIRLPEKPPEEDLVCSPPCLLDDIGQIDAKGHFT